MKLRSILIASLALAACSDSIPAEPTYFADVQPILQAQCGRCHGADPIDPVVDYFRLDRYVAGDTLSVDAHDMVLDIVTLAVERRGRPMPPEFALSDRHRTILRRWADSGAPKGSRDNTLPTVTAVSSPEDGSTVDQELALTIRSLDADGDGLVVAIGTRVPGASGGDVAASGLGGGTREVSIDTGQIASMSRVEVYAIVDDGYSDDPLSNQHEVVLLEDIFIDHGERGTAPTVTLLSPNGNETLIGDSQITWSATDPDPGDELTIDLDLIRVDADGTESVVASIASDLPNSPSSFFWDLSAVEAVDGSGNPIRYKVRVTATDIGAKNTRSDDSDATFSIIAAGGTTELTWADVRPIFVTYCGECHSATAKNAAIDYFRLDKYDAAHPEPPQNSDLGVFEVKGIVFDRMVVAGNMPPNSDPQPSAAEVAQIEEWILAGAPYGEGGGVPTPTFTWVTPNDSAIARTNTGDITLSWVAVSNPAGMMLTGSIEYAPLSAPSDQLANCTASLTGWTELTTNVEAGTFDWTVPSTGYFCLRGTVTDEMAETTTSMAAKPVKYQMGGPPQ